MGTLFLQSFTIEIELLLKDIFLLDNAAYGPPPNLGEFQIKLKAKYGLHAFKHNICYAVEETGWESNFQAILPTKIL